MNAMRFCARHATAYSQHCDLCVADIRAWEERVRDTPGICSEWTAWLFKVNVFVGLAILLLVLLGARTSATTWYVWALWFSVLAASMAVDLWRFHQRWRQ